MRSINFSTYLLTYLPDGRPLRDIGFIGHISYVT